MATKLVEKHAELPREAVRLAVVADTHAHPHDRAYALIRARQPDAILHAGDIGGVDVVDALGEIAPTFAIRGNIDVGDARARPLPDVLVLDHPALRILLVHIGVYGPKLRAEVGKRARDAGARLVVCGHSHVPFIGVDRGLYVFNPGSIGPRRFHLPIVFGMIELRPTIQLTHVDCETGEQWSPP